MLLLLKNRYRILQTLSEAGGFGQTFLAEDTDMPSRRRCVIKKLRPIVDAEDFKFVRERFDREAAILERLGNKCDQIPKLYAYFAENQEFYLVQELIEGLTLRLKVQNEGVQDENTVRGLLSSLLNILEYVHSQNIIHRDIKPDNIILRQHDGKPVLIDFGIVKEISRVLIDGSPASSVLLGGTPGYVASEQIAGRPVYASDIYSLGATAIYLLTGRNPQQMTDLATGDIAWQHFAPQVTSAFASVLNKATESHIRDRYKTIEEMRDALNNLPQNLEISPKEEERKQIEQSKTRKLADVFPPNLDFYFEKIGEAIIGFHIGSKLAITYIELIIEMIERFEEALRERGIPESYVIDERRIGSTLLTVKSDMNNYLEFLTPGKNHSGKSYFLDPRGGGEGWSTLMYDTRYEMKRLIKIAGEIDEKYTNDNNHSKT